MNKLYLVHCGYYDPEHGPKSNMARKIPAEWVKPERELGAHVAALGMRFYRDKILIAEHGSWNRSEPQGYRVMEVALKDGKASSYEPFAEGWLQKGSPWGRPVDLLVLPDGDILLSDDMAGVIYRISNKSS